MLSVSEGDESPRPPETLDGPKSDMRHFAAVLLAPSWTVNMKVQSNNCTLRFPFRCHRTHRCSEVTLLHIRSDIEVFAVWAKRVLRRRATRRTTVGQPSKGGARLPTKPQIRHKNTCRSDLYEWVTKTGTEFISCRAKVLRLWAL